MRRFLFFLVLLPAQILFSQLCFAEYHGISYSFSQPKEEFTDPVETINQKVAYINGLYEKVVHENRFTEILDVNVSADLPRAIKQVIGGRVYAIIIDSVIFTPSGAYFNAHCVLELPWNENRIYFSANGIEFHPGGLTGKFRLNLVREERIPFGQNNLIIKADLQKTFVEFSCEGFQSFGFKAEYEFSKDLLVRENSDGSLNHSEQVRVEFEVTGADLNDIIARAAIPPFQVKGLTGFGFYVEDAILDLSDLNNPSGINFPLEYQPILNSYGITNLWQGIYLREVNVKIPSKYEKRGSPRVEFGVRDLILDHHGLTGMFYGRELIPIEQGDLGGWAFSLDSLGVRLVANQLSTAGFDGQLQLPVMKEDKSLRYAGIIEKNDNYFFNVLSSDKIDIPLWAAKAELAPGSSIEVTVANKKFQTKAILHGKLYVNAPFGKDPDNKAKLAGVSFEGLTIQSIAPYLTVQQFGLDESGDDGQANLSNFPISLKNVSYISEGEKVGISFLFAVNLSKPEDKGFAGEAGLRVMGEMVNGDRRSYRFDNIYLDKIRLDVDADAFRLKGELDIYRNDVVYGRGFKGMIDAWFQPGIGVAATAQFGNVNGFRYWYVDAKAILSTGIPIMPGVGIYGFIGGAYHKMRQGTAQMERAEPGMPVILTDNSDQSGVSFSGAVYVPDANIGLGLKAGVVLATLPKPDPLNADVVFEIQFNSNGGINMIGFSGEAYVMTPLSKRDGTASVYGGFAMQFDIPNKTLHANLQVHVNAGPVKGIGENYKAGWCVLHFAPQEWYIYVGTPENRVGITLFNALKVGGYFVAGTEIPGFPAPPPEVASILGEADFDMMRDENALGGGGGFAFGAAIAMSTGDKTFLMFYGSFDAGIGFDIMMKNYGNSVRCAGRSEPMGMKGWYASGQLYAYVQGSVGINAKVFGQQRKVEILSLGVAAILQAKLPNPTWMQGTVGGRYSVLGGLISGNCKFQLTIGEECQMVAGGSVLATIKIIEDITPSVGASDVSVFNSPQALFNLPVEKTFELVDFDGRPRFFRAKLDYLKVLDGSTEIRGEIVANSHQDVYVFNSHDILPPEKKISVKVKVVFEELIMNAWRPVVVDGAVQTESKESDFTTGKAPDHIPHSNVAYSYPVLNQYNYLKNESSHGYVTLIKGQPYLFNTDNGKWNFAGRLAQGGNGNIINLGISYDGEAKQVNYSIPQNIENSTLYTFRFLRIPASENKMLDANVSETSTESTSEAGTMAIKTKSAEGVRENLQEKEIFITHFRTSIHNTFIQKMQSFKYSNGGTWPIANGVHELSTSLQGDEVFDKFEIHGKERMQPLISFDATLSDNYYTSHVHPLVYDGYPLLGRIRIFEWRNPEDLGLPPSRGIFIGQADTQKEVTENEALSGNAQALTGSASIVYMLPFYYYMDYQEIRQHVANTLIKEGTNSRVDEILTGRLVSIKPGVYELDASYILPGTDIISSSYKVSIKLKK
ncbi:MAG: hypothetical protein ACK4ND_07695 [Cytophagaceae bacterium]